MIALCADKRSGFRIPAAAIFVAGMTAFSPHSSVAQAQTATGNLGTLICTLDPGTRGQVGVERQISCNFNPVSGPNAKFKGIVKRVGAKIPGQRKIVLAWSVLGPTNGSSDQLEGRYVGALESKPSMPAGLTGGRNGRVTLRPLAANPSIGDNAAVSIMELDLSGMRA